MAAIYNPYHYVAYGPDTNCTLAVCPVEASVLGYRPSVPANAVFIALFAVGLAVHLVQGLRYRQTLGSFAGPVVLGCLDEIIGYAGRLMLYHNPFSFSGFLMQIICITTSPVFFCAAIYVTLAKTIVYLDVSLSRFNPKFLYWFFIPCDIVSLALQAAGGATSSTGADGSGASGSGGGSGTDVGVALSLAGLAFQVFTLLVFIALSADYLLRYGRAQRRGRRLNGRPQQQQHPARFRVFLAFLWLAILFILIRCVYRIDELSEGYDGDLFRNEKIFYGLESAMVVAAVFCLNGSQPGFGMQAASRKLATPEAELTDHERT